MKTFKARVPSYQKRGCFKPQLDALIALRLFIYDLPTQKFDFYIIIIFYITALTK